MKVECEKMNVLSEKSKEFQVCMTADCLSCLEVRTKNANYLQFGKTCLTFLVICQLSIFFCWKFVNEFLFMKKGKWKKVLYSALSWTGRTEKICEISTGTSFNPEAQPLHHKRQ